MEKGEYFIKSSLCRAKNYFSRKTNLKQSNSLARANKTAAPYDQNIKKKESLNKLEISNTWTAVCIGLRINLHPTASFLTAERTQKKCRTLR